MWNALQVLTQGRRERELSFMPEKEQRSHPSLGFALTLALVRGCRQQCFQPAQTVQGTDREWEWT